MMVNGARLWQIDALKGVAILFVVLMHAYYPVPAWAGAGERDAAHVLYFVGHLAVPVFFTLSGYLFAYEHRPGRDVIIRKASTILLPALVWSAAALTIRALWFDLDARQAAIDAVLFNASGQYYYVLVLVILFTGGLALRGQHPRLLTVIALLALAISIARVALADRYPPEGAIANTFQYRDPLIWAGYFLIGYRAGVHPIRLAATTRLALAAALAASLVWWLRSGGVDDSYFTVPMTAAGVVVAAFTACLLARPTDDRPAWSTPLGWLGRHSFAIFLVHMPIFIGLVSDDFFAETGTEAYWTRVGFRFVVGVAGSLAVVAFVRAALPQRFSRFIGFEGRPSRPARPAGRPSPLYGGPYPRPLPAPRKT